MNEIFTKNHFEIKWNFNLHIHFLKLSDLWHHIKIRERKFSKSFFFIVWFYLTFYEIIHIFYFWKIIQNSFATFVNCLMCFWFDNCYSYIYRSNASRFRINKLNEFEFVNQQTVNGNIINDKFNR